MIEPHILAVLFVNLSVYMFLHVAISNCTNPYMTMLEGLSKKAHLTSKNDLEKYTNVYLFIMKLWIVFLIPYDEKIAHTVF